MSVCCHKCGVKLFVGTNHKCVDWFVRLRIWMSYQIKKIASKISGSYWKCTNCGFVDMHEREVRCWCCGLGEMIYQG